MRLVRRIGLAITVVLVVLLVAAGVVGVTTVRASWPETTGTISLPSLTGTVRVLRDARGVPHIYAGNTADLMRAQGFVSAQDRFFEMDLRRHVTAGRLSELVGDAGVATDKVIRTLGWRRIAEQELPKLSADTRQNLDAYAEGVNDYLRSHTEVRAISLEYTILGMRYGGYTPEPWSALDSVAWLKAMAWDLKGDYGNELARATLAPSVSAAQLALLYPPYPYDAHKPILSAQDWTPQSVQSGLARPVPALLRNPSLAATWSSVRAAVDAVPVTLGRGEGIGSNSWVVGPSKSTTGAPQLANDPHLGVGIPGIWMQVGLHCTTVSDACPFDVSGFSFSGVPGIVIGHNDHIAWSFTNLGPDVSDFYLEKVSGDTYLYDGKQVPLVTRTETIKVAGGTDVTITVRSTGHGPILSDVISSVADMGRKAPVNAKIAKESYAVSLAWTGLRPGATADAIFGLNLARDFTDFRTAAELFAVPSQNLLYADREGHIGYQAPGLVPIRGSSVNGAPPGYWPAPGWDSTYDWKGFLPFEALPFTFDPPEGVIVAANQAVTGEASPFLTTEWDYGFRAQRIRTELTATAKVSPEKMAEIQLDTRNGFAPTLAKALLAIDLRSDPFTRSGQNLLRRWDYTQPAGRSSASAAASYYNAVWRRLLLYTFEELPADLGPDGGARWMAAVGGLLREPTNAWWDDRNTRGVVEGEQEILRKALVQARLDLTEQLGKEPATWIWGRLHS
ncbi:MAG TPA: penicillin acylase family protein, partial [Candidatus Lustribacter sp.]|nr:penicillin acylase family protein [Candidatus Lustribacter sp.]